MLVKMLGWAIWKCRNEIVWRQKSIEALGVVELAKRPLINGGCAQDRNFDNYLGYMTAADGAEKWRSPNIDTIKVNVHAVIFNSSNCYSDAFAVRDSHGNPVKARAKCTHWSITPETAEAVGIREVLSWIKDREWSKVELKSDFLSLIQVVRESSIMLSYFGRLIEECKQLIDSRWVVLNFVKRSMNMVANFLA